ncbi:ATP-binding protein [Caballeronia sp. S22]|uniref:ATP-binding protein n=1 Tax=Caballeronia sp. S22 TaxID=3137182 RepID=UPI0035314B2F
MELFREQSDLRIGKVVEISGTSIRVEMDPAITELTRTIEGRVYAVGQLASVVKIHYGRRVLFAYVRMLRMKSELLSDEGQHQRILPGDDSRILEADLFAEGTWSPVQAELSYSRGVETYPLPLQSVYLTTTDELEALYESAERVAGEEVVTPLVSLGEYVGANGAQCRANIDRLFSQHCAVLGSTGSGKSGTVAALLHSILEHKDAQERPLKPRIVLIDPHGEYAAAFPGKSTVYSAYTASAGSEPDGGSAELKLPFWTMSGDELRTLIIGKTEAEATSQNNIIYKALKHSRMVGAGIVKPLREEVKGDQEEEYVDGKSAIDALAFDRDKPVKFSIAEFRRHIDEVQGRKENEVKPLAKTERKSVESILDKLSVLESDPRLRFIMADHQETLQDILQQFVGSRDAQGQLRIVDISGLPNEVAGILTAAIARILFNYKVWQKREERERDPIVLVCEEAHRYVPDRGDAQYREAQDAVRRVAREGRKYGLGLMLVSQRPADVESTVLSQCSSWIVLRLTNGADQEHVSRFLPDSLAGLTKILSSLSRREAVFVGEAAALPSRIKIRKLEEGQLPRSADIRYSLGWTQTPLSDDELTDVVTRWTGY